MHCREWTAEIVECARAGSAPGRALQTHVADCAECRARWQAEQVLAGPIRKLRAVVSAERCSSSGRDRVMAAFDKRHIAAKRRRGWVWGFAAAAAVLFALALGLSRSSKPPALAVAEEMADDGGFVPVPYAAPLAAGEFVRVVRTELYAGALYRMGVPAPASSGQFPADVVLGQDGLPRAVRVLEDVSF
jgi:hypothetical protein